MATKTISLRIDAYERLRKARRNPSESFSDVVMRAKWDNTPLTGAQLLQVLRERGPCYESRELSAVERVSRLDQPPRNKGKEG